MAARLSALSAGSALLPRNIFLVFRILISDINYDINITQVASVDGEGVWDMKLVTPSL
jgi:hypothetical protein